MLGWLRSIFGVKKPAAQDYPLVREVPRKQPAVPRTPPPPVPPEAPPEAETLVEEAHGAFLGELVAPRPEVNLQALAPEDRLFVSGVLKKVREKQLHVPVLPQAAMQISKLLADPNSDARGFAKVLEADPALSVDVLRIANSAFYGFSQKTNSVKDAVIRIGLTQLRGLIIVTHLQGKILQGSAFRRESEWVVDLSMAVAQLAQSLAQPLGLGKDEAFTRGVLSHVEYFVIMGAVADISREHQKTPTAHPWRTARHHPTVRGERPSPSRTAMAARHPHGRRLRRRGNGPAIPATTRSPGRRLVAGGPAGGGRVGGCSLGQGTGGAAQDPGGSPRGIGPAPPARFLRSAPAPPFSTPPGQVRGTFSPEPSDRGVSRR